MSLPILIFSAVMVVFGASAAGQPIPSAPMPIQMPPLPPSPIDQFRQWLKVPVGEREQALAEYPESKRAILREKLRLYEAMPAEQRERRLKMLELRWYLRPLMSLSPGQRGDSLKMIPPRLQGLVSERIAQWDRMDPQVRQEILANEDARELVTGYFVHIRRNPVTGPDLHPLDEKKRAELQNALKRWNQTSPVQRANMSAQLTAFFELPRTAQQKTLGAFPESERIEMQKTLDAFARLSPQYRRICVDSFGKFATMSPRERASFLRNAERWQQMSPEEREAWRKLVTKLPPMPPEPIPAPPRPPA
jgi:hypothetical protein